MPLRDAPPMPPKKLRGTDITSAHGQETTRKARALYTQSAKPPPFIIGGITASKAAIITTVGVYIRENFVINLSDFDFLPLAFSTSSRILLTVDSPNSLVTWAVITPLKFIVPLKSSSPGTTSRGSDSPVKAEVSKVELPEISLLSRGIFSPGLIIIISPTFTLSGSVFTMLSPIFTFA